MTNVEKYMEDGANYQAQAVLAFFKRSSNIEESWNKEHSKYDAEIKVARWENCREQGYVLMMRTKDYAKQLNIAFFEHRNSDEICAIKWEECTTNSPTIESKELGEVYKTKWDTSKSVSYGQVVEMSEWLINEFTAYWKANSPSKSV